MISNISHEDLVAEAQKTWSSETWGVFRAARDMFISEVNERLEFGRALSSARQARQLTQTALSELSGVQQAEISRIENGVANPTAETLMRLADALELRLALVK